METKKAKPILLGIIIDASASMERSWKNVDEQMPSLKVIRDILDKEFRRISSLQKLASSKRKSPTVDLFCLGMGFQKPSKDIIEKSISNKSKKNRLHKDVSSKPITPSFDVDVVCDLLALTQIIPSENQLEQICDILNKNWNDYANEILARAINEEDADEALREYIQLSLYNSAYNKFEHNWKYRWWTKLKANESKSSKASSWLLKTFTRELFMRHDKIARIAQQESQNFSRKVKNKALEIFGQNQQKYNTYIEEKLDAFIATQVSIILRLLSIGYNQKIIFNYFDQNKAFSLAKEIYDCLYAEVENSIRIAWLENRVTLNLAKRNIGATLDNREIKRLTERAIHKNGWNILQPFVEELVYTLFKKSFRQKVRILLPEWIELASMRELTRAAKDINKILPDDIENEVYSKDFCMVKPQLIKP